MLHPPVDCFNHLWLDVFCVDEPVWSDPPGQSDFEPAAACAEIGDDRAVCDPERVHDLVGLVPLVAIGRFKQPKILRRIEAWLLLGRRRWSLTDLDARNRKSGKGWMGSERRQGRM